MDLGGWGVIMHHYNVILHQYFTFYINYQLYLQSRRKHWRLSLSSCGDFEMSVDEVQWYFADILVDQTVEIEVQRVGAGPDQVAEYVVVRVEIIYTCSVV